MLLIFFINNISIPTKYIVGMCNRLWEKRPHLQIYSTLETPTSGTIVTAKAEEASLAVHASQQSILLSLPQKTGKQNHEGHQLHLSTLIVKFKVSQ